MKFSRKCSTKKLGIGKFLLIFFINFNWEGADIRPQIKPWKKPGFSFPTEEMLDPWIPIED